MKNLTRTETQFQFGDDVVVTETNIRPWTGTVVATKWSRVSGWWMEIRRPDGEVWAIPERYVSPGQEG